MRRPPVTIRVMSIAPQSQGWRCVSTASDPGRSRLRSFHPLSTRRAGRGSGRPRRAACSAVIDAGPHAGAAAPQPPGAPLSRALPPTQPVFPARRRPQTSGSLGAAQGAPDRRGRTRKSLLIVGFVNPCQHLQIGTDFLRFEARYLPLASG